MNDSKVTLVTGATRGIGRAAVAALVARGRQVVASGRDPSLLTELERTYPGRVRTVACDLGQAGAAEWLVDEALRRFGSVNEFVYSAGVVHYAAVGKVSEADLRAQLEVNFVAPFLMSQRLGLHMRAQGGGSVVHVASTLGVRAAASTSAYAASKAALIQATEALALELAPEVRVNAVAPGVVDTDMIRVPRLAKDDACAADDALQTAAINAQVLALTALHPLGRLGLPTEVADAILFLLDASWITGTTLRIDGGLLTR